MKFRKKPVVIEAFQWKPDAHVSETPNWFFEACARSECWPEFDRTLSIRTLEGTMAAQVGDWIIRGVQGELYPCKPDIFAATYEPADIP